MKPLNFSIINMLLIYLNILFMNKKKLNKLIFSNFDIYKFIKNLN